MRRFLSGRATVMPETKPYGNYDFLRKEAKRVSFRLQLADHICYWPELTGKALMASFRVPQPASLLQPHVDVHCLFSEPTD